MQILNKTMIPIEIYPSLAWLWFASIPFVVGMVLLIITKEENWITFSLAGTAVTLILIGLICSQLCVKRIPSDKYRYEVTLDESYSASKLYDE